MQNKMNVLMVASENDALPGGKVGGIGDVVRDAPVALAEAGCLVHVVTPAYRLFSRLPGADRIDAFAIPFAGENHEVTLYQVPPKVAVEGVTHWAIELPDWVAPAASGIYCNDPPEAPFATDATKFACFCSAVATAIIRGCFGALEVVHLHDWHAAMLLLLRQYDASFEALRGIRTVYTIHNLALQGVRPLHDHASSLGAWFPGLNYEQQVVNDPHAAHCINPMRTGINLSDKVHVVSPTYAKEILLPSDPERGYIGGEGLQADLVTAQSQGKLVGILNGCNYSAHKGQKWSKTKLAKLLNEQMLALIAKHPVVDSALYIAQQRIALFSGKKSLGMLVTSVGRITDQKVRLLCEVMPSGQSALDELLIQLGSEGAMILLGSGDSALEQFLTEVAGRRENFIFVKGYSEALSEALYQAGDLFLMPSSFEPCGISQMLAMREGQPCLVHGVGGLNDTVKDNVSGFSFHGDSLAEQAANMLKCFAKAKTLKQERGEQWKEIGNNAANERFLWRHSAEQYISDIYQA